MGDNILTISNSWFLIGLQELIVYRDLRQQPHCRTLSLGYSVVFNGIGDER